MGQAKSGQILSNQKVTLADVAMTSPQQLEILDLRHFTARQMRPLLQQEARLWRQRLRWDYSSSTELLLQYLDSRILPGFVALTRGRICGFTFCVYEGQKAVVGDIYAAAENPEPLAVVHTLTRHLLETLDASPDIDRVEAQLLLFEAGVLPPAFGPTQLAGRTLHAYPRLFLEKDLSLERELSPAQPGLIGYPPEVELCRWAAAYYTPTAELIQAAYLGHVDAEINDQYRTLAGSLRFLHNIIRFPGCGVFDPDCSWLLRDRRNGALVAVLLCSRVAPETAHLTQVCVAPAWRGRGIGRMLLAECMQRLPASGYRWLTLTVSEANTEALGLYLRAGFQLRQRFDALVIDKGPRSGRLKLVGR